MGSSSQRLARSARPRIGLAVLVTAVILAGCGGSSHSSSHAAQSATTAASASVSSTSSDPATTTTSAGGHGKSSGPGGSKHNGSSGAGSSTTPQSRPGRRHAQPVLPLNPAALLKARPHNSFEVTINRACARGNVAAAKYTAGYRAAFLARDYAKLAQLRDSAIRAFEAVANPLTFTPPAADKTKYQRYVTASEQFAKAGYALDNQLRAHNLSGAGADQSQLAQAEAARAQAALALGARACAI